MRENEKILLLQDYKVNKHLFDKFGIDYEELLNKPDLSTVATSGSYEDLLNKPDFPDLSTLSTVATTGSYDDLIDKPIGTNPHGTTKSDVGLGNVDNTSDLLKPISTATQSALNDKISTSQKGVTNGVAQLNENGVVPSSQLPSYVDDVLEYTSNSLFPATGESGKIYINTTTNLTYRWTGSGYAEISPSIALGETSSTAYAGDKGKATTDKVNGHIGNTSNPHGVTKTQVGLGNVDNTADNTKNVLSATKLATARTIFGRLFDGTTNISGQASVHGNYQETPGNRYANGALEIRECDLVVDTQSDIGYAPQIGFRWAGKDAGSIVMGSNGEFQILNLAGTGYSNLRINTLYGNVIGNATSSTKLATSRNIALTGDVTGSVNFDGSGNVDITSTVVDDSHNHIVDNVDGLQNILDEKATQSNINTSINAIQIGGRNLLLKSNVPAADTNYSLKRYRYGEQVALHDEMYTATIKFELGADRIALYLYTGEGYVNVVPFYNSDRNSEGIASKTFIMKYTAGRFPEDGFAYIDFYQHPNSGTTTSSIEWVKLEKGNKATDWTPAPEDVDSAIALKADKTTSGTTATRPIPTHIGQTHFDTTLGRPIWCKTVETPVWVDSTGTVV